MRQHQAVTKVMLVLALAIAVGLAACGGDDGGGVRTVTVAPAETPAQDDSGAAQVSGEAILIETRVTNARRHTGVVLARSAIGESAFCRGGKTSGGSEGPTITATFHCPGGTLKVQYAPTQPSRVQSAVWEVVTATGEFRGLRGGGSMVAEFDRDDPDIGRETFTGTVGR
jgi:hypothetical protein